uniref:Uncharacterized protein n=1 Tax=viral metagenome TaxID=1070528 RepID=A0A6M3KHL9_9ZZZZ
MARARNIKPGFFKNESLVELSYSTRLLFIGLWTLADREGRIEDRPKRIKMEIFPGDDVGIERGLTELHEAGFIHRYEANGGRYIEVCAFLKHQNPHYKEAASTIPKPEAYTHDDRQRNLGFNTQSKASKPEVRTGQTPDKPQASPADSLIPDSLIPDSLIPDSLQKKEQARLPRATRLPKDFVLSKEMGDWALSEQPTWDVEYTRKIGEMFRDYWVAVPGQRGLKLDWGGTWRNWVRKEGPRPSGAGGKGGAPWWSSEAGTLAKGKEMDLQPRAGEAMVDFRGRINAKMGE